MFGQRKDPGVKATQRVNHPGKRVRALGEKVRRGQLLVSAGSTLLESD